MALTQCKECGEQISTEADACPKCGAKRSKKTSAFTWIVVILVIYGVYVVASIDRSPSSTGLKAGDPIKSNPVKVAPPESSWVNEQSRDEMTGKRSSYASSPTVASKAPMSFPYQNTKAWLAVGCDKGSEWAYIGFTQAPNLNDTKIQDGYNLITTRFKWNDTVQTITLNQKWGAEFIHFQNPRDAIRRIAAGSTSVLELDWHGQQPVHFEFTLRGASAAVSAIRSECSKY
jgi:hypothetical protein